MGVTEKKSGKYGFLFKWIVLLGDLLCINTFYLLVYKFAGFFLFQEVNLSSNVVLILLLLINLSYFFVSYIVPNNILSNILYFDRIIRRSLFFITLYAIVLTVGVVLFVNIHISWYIWILSYVLLSITFLAWHIAFRIVLKAYRGKGRNFKNIIIIGSSPIGLDINRELSSSVYGYRNLGVFDDKEPSNELIFRYRGPIDNVEQFCLDENVDEIYCTLQINESEKVAKLLNFAERNMIRFFLVPEFYKYINRKLVLTFLQSTPVLTIREEPLQSFSNRLLKRGFDVAFSLGMLVTVFPVLYIICGLIIKIESPGPVMFKQERTGLKGKPFVCYKFRSMKLNKEADSQSAVKSDPRVTRIGAFMRKTNIDELPQFINVLRGEMSVVGPRPHMIKHTETYNKLLDTFMIRHIIKPGLTGWAQVSGYRGEVKTVDQMEGRLKHDVWYIENWSFMLDVKILFVTLFKMFKGDKNAY